MQMDLQLIALVTFVTDPDWHLGGVSRPCMHSSAGVVLLRVACCVLLSFDCDAVAQIRQ